MKSFTCPLLSCLAAAMTMALVWVAPGARAQQVLCTTTLEAPLRAGAAPLELSRCALQQSTAEFVLQRFFAYTAPYAVGVSSGGQLRELFGIATGTTGALGFTDQTIVWDGSALSASYDVLLERQSGQPPLRTSKRTSDLFNGFNGSLGQ